MKLKLLLIAYVLFLIGVSVLANADILPSTRSLLRAYAPNTWFTQHLPPRIPYDDKLAHFGLTGILSLLLNLVLRLATFSLGKIKILKGNLFLLFVVTLEEGSQVWFPHRSLSLSDLLSNYAGILCFGYLAVWIVNHRQWLESKLPRLIARSLWPSSL